MFKPGEIAGVKGTDRRVVVKQTIVSKAPDGSPRWPVETSDGIFEEGGLFVAHPTVLVTAEGRDLSMEEFWSRHSDKGGLSTKLRDKLEKILKRAQFDCNGHWKDGSALDKDFLGKELKHMFLSRDSVSVEDADEIVKAARGRKPIDRWVPLNVHMSIRTCSYCGEDDFVLETNGKTIRISGDACKFKEGLPPTEWEMNVPSGKIVVANDLRRLFPLPDDDDSDINTLFGCRQTVLSYAANGLSHAFVGNTCPGVYRLKGDRLKIANPPQKEEWNGKEYVEVVPKPKFVGKRVAGVCTDLWWYSVCDRAEFQRRCKRFGAKAKDFNVEVVDVKPGVYAFRHDEEACRDDGPSERVYTRFKWVRDPDPVQDFLTPYGEVDVNPHAYVQAQVARWPTLYGRVERRPGKEVKVPWSEMSEEDRLGSWKRVADHVFFTIGGGTEWHEKGFPAGKVDPSIPDMEPPAFRSQCHWYPFSKKYGGLYSKHLSPSFAKLLFRALESVISFGTDVNDSPKGREVPYVRERMLLAVERYRQLAKKYPEQADPEYVAWLSQKGRAEAWVKDFDLGPEYTEKHRDHALKQRWVPEGSYAVEFDARKLNGAVFGRYHFSTGEYWANQATAKRYALNEWKDNGQKGDRNCFWTCHARDTSVPLYTVARIVKLGDVSHMGETLVEIAFDYGNPWMLDATKRKALIESGEKEGIRVLTKEEYEALLPSAVQFFEESKADSSA